jgi:hypothetical protein
MSDKDFDVELIIESMAVILGVPKLDLSIENIGETGPLKSYYISKCCCFHENKTDEKEIGE